MSEVIVSNQNAFTQTVAAIREAGPDKLHVISDFDRTLTYAFHNREKIPSIISTLRDGNYLSADYAAKAHALFNYYHEIEKDQTISPDKKKQLMHEWRARHYQLLIDAGLERKDIEDVVARTPVIPRAGVDMFVQSLAEAATPFLILSSSGIGGDAIPLFLQKHHLHTDNIYVVSNRFIWDDDGKAIDIDHPIVHTMNKSEVAIVDTPIYDKVQQRKNLLLLGDNLHDPHMADGLVHDHILKIGFLNYDIDANIDTYKEKYDMIITNDGDFTAVNELLEQLL